MLVAFLLPNITALTGQDAWFETVEQVATASQEAPSTSPYARRGDEVEMRYRAYNERLESFYERLSAGVRENAPELHPTLEAAPPKAVLHGYHILPKLVPDGQAPPERPRIRPAWYSWPWTQRLIELQVQKIEGLEAERDHILALTPTERRAGYGKLVADYLQLPESLRTIDAHMQYNRLWQPAIAHDRAGYDHQTALYHAVLERQAIRDALSTTDDSAFHKALNGVRGIDLVKGRDALETELREREKILSREIHEATDRMKMTPPPFLRVEHPTPRRWVVHVPFYTDIADTEFVQSFKVAVESLWRLRGRDEEFGVQLSMTYVSATQLYRERPECGRRGHVACVPPRKGEQIDLGAHVALFPNGGGVLTTGAISTHVTGRAIALGPHDITPHVLAHEFGHILGFRDLYVRGYQDLGGDGFQVMEVSADPEDIMGAPGTGPVLRGHFEKVIGLYSSPSS